MAYTASTLSLHPDAPGTICYYYRTTDTMATVAAGSYFTSGIANVGGTGPNLVAGDLIWCQCTDGNMWLKVYSVVSSTGAVATQFAGGNLPIQTFATGTAAGDFPLKVGYYEIGTSVYGTGTRAVLPTPYAGAEVKVFKIDSGTTITHFDAGASLVDISLGASGGATGGGTGVTYDGTARRINLVQRGEYFHVVASSSTRWRLQTLFVHASAVSEGGSVVFLGT